MSASTARYQNLTDETLRKADLQAVLRKIDPRFRLTSVETLGGRARALNVSMADAGGKRLVLLTHSHGDRQLNPHIARDEYRLLRILREAGLPVPRVLYLCETHEPHFLVTAFVDGSAECGCARTGSCAGALASILKDIHALDLGALDLAFLPRAGDRILRERWPLTDDQRRIRAAMGPAASRIQVNAPALLHGDFWPGNLLWRKGELAAIIDWEDAMIGDPLADLGKSRLEILWALGWHAMREYSARYLELNPQLDADPLPYWDLWGAFRLSHFASFAPHQSAIPRMAAQYKAFVDDAIRRLDAFQK
ncbi:MAG: phosphotransferase [Chloroflexi bacterium]|nr:phosphotransferase [Chloroflexota bacterium]